MPLTDRPLGWFHRWAVWTMVGSVTLPIGNLILGLGKADLNVAFFAFAIGNAGSAYLSVLLTSGVRWAWRLTGWRLPWQTR